MNLQALLAECYRRLNFMPAPAASVTVRLTAALNEAHRRVLASPGMEQLRDETTTIFSIAGQSRIGLPANVAKIQGLTDVTGQRRLRAMRRSDERRVDPGGTSSGVPEAYAPITEQCVQFQPSAPTDLLVATSNGADTTGVVKVASITDGGYTAAGTATLNGVTHVSISGGHTDHIVVTQFSLPVVRTGTVTLYDGSGNELGTIEAGKTANKFHAIELWPSPAAQARYTLDYTRNIADLVDATDEPCLPPDFHYLLVTMACRREFTFADDSQRYAEMAAEEQEAIRALRSFVLYPPDYRARNTDPETETNAGSNLGGYYPAGRW